MSHFLNNKVSDDNTPVLHSLIENYLLAVEKINNNTDPCKYASSIISDSVSDSIYKEVNEEMHLLQKVSLFFEIRTHKPTLKKVAQIVIKYIRLNKIKIIPIAQKMIIRNSNIYKRRLMQILEKSLKVTPEIENRSVLLNNRRVIEFNH